MSEALAIRLDNAETSTTSAPSAASDGLLAPDHRRLQLRCHLHLEKAASSGTRTARVKVHGYRTQLHTQDDGIGTGTGDLTAVASSGAWFEIFDTGELSDAANFNKSYLLQGAQDFERLATQVITNGGTSPTLTTALAFAGVENS